MTNEQWGSSILTDEYHQAQRDKTRLYRSILDNMTDSNMRTLINIGRVNPLVNSCLAHYEQANGSISFEDCLVMMIERMHELNGEMTEMLTNALSRSTASNFVLPDFSSEK
jgi:hypothetical protein